MLHSKWSIFALNHQKNLHTQVKSLIHLHAQPEIQLPKLSTDHVSGGACPRLWDGIYLNILYK
jgi:hypothetical protein